MTKKERYSLYNELLSFVGRAESLAEAITSDIAANRKPSKSTVLALNIFALSRVNLDEVLTLINSITKGKPQ